MMDPKQLQSILEAAIFVAGSPVPLSQLAALFPEQEKPTNDMLRAALAEIREAYADRAIELKEVASGYQFQSKVAYSPWLQKLWEEKPARYSRALLETLALVAYRQPITRAEIEEVRGVAVSSQIIRTLLEREWVRAVGHRDVPGKPALYATTKKFLDYFNLKGLHELPALSELKDLSDAEEKLVEQMQLDMTATPASETASPEVSENSINLKEIFGYNEGGENEDQEQSNAQPETISD